jgi:hypothetical protein
MYSCLDQCYQQGLEKDDAGPHSGPWHGLLGRLLVPDIVSSAWTRMA